MCGNKRAGIDGILVEKGNIFLSGSTSAALGKCKKNTPANGKNKGGNLCIRTRRS